jgi:hypothetical protein
MPAGLIAVSDRQGALPWPISIRFQSQRVVKDHPRVAAVAKRFPMGVLSVLEGSAHSILPATTP